MTLMPLQSGSSIWEQWKSFEFSTERNSNDIAVTTSLLIEKRSRSDYRFDSIAEAFMFNHSSSLQCHFRLPTNHNKNHSIKFSFKIITRDILMDAHDKAYRGENAKGHEREPEICLPFIVPKGHFIMWQRVTQHEEGREGGKEKKNSIITTTDLLFLECVFSLR